MKMTLRRQLTIFMLISICMVLFVTMFAFTIIIDVTYKEQRIDMLYEKVKVMENNIGKRMLDFVSGTDRLRNDEDFRTLLDKEDKTIEDIESINESLHSSFVRIGTISAIYIVDNKNNIINSFSNVDLGGFDDVLEIAKASNREEYFSEPNNFPYYSAPYNDYITYVAKIRNPNTLETDYNLIISFNKNTVLQFIYEKDSAYFDNIIIFDDKGAIIYKSTYNNDILLSSKEAFLENKLTDYVKKDNNVYFFHSISNYSNWKVVASTSNARLQQGYSYVIIALLSVGLFLVFIVYIIIQFLSNKIIRPIKTIQNAMDVFRDGDMSKRVDVEAPIEVAALIDGYNLMAERIEKNVAELIAKHEEVRVAEIEALKFKYELLQNQINPHFLHNTLNTVSYLALAKRNDDIRTLIQSLNILLRSVMNVDEEYVTLKKEFEILQSYVRIQNFRFDNPIILDYDLPKELENVKILKLLLQPIIENSIIHGILPKDMGNGRILIKVLNLKDAVEVIVADNGIGLDDNESENITKKINSKGFNRIGLSNINERIKMIYGSKLSIAGVKGVGTLVYFQIKKGDIDEEK